MAAYTDFAEQMRKPQNPRDAAAQAMGGGAAPPMLGESAPPALSAAMGGGAAPPTLPAGSGGAAPPTAPSATATPAPSGQPWYTKDDVTSFQSWAQNRYGRQATGDELAKIGSNSTNMASAQAYADQLAQQQGWKPPATATPTTPYTPGPGVAPPPLEAAPPPSAMDQQAQALIQKMLATNTGDVNTGSQEYQSQLGSFKRGQQRQLERAKNAAAERGAATGTLNTGGFEAGQQAMDLAGAQQTGDFEAGLAGQQIGRQREDVQNALGLAQQRGLTTEANQLRERLAKLDSTMQQQGLNLQGELGRGDLDLRKYLGRGQLGLGLLGQLLGDKQAGNALGFNYASLQNQMNQQSLSQLLGGL